METELEGARRPAIWFQRSPRSRSKLGGLPELPPGTPWPRQGKTNTPLHFLAQIDLVSLPATPLVPGGPTLPRKGMLSFFGDIEEEMLWDGQEIERGTPYDCSRVIFTDSNGVIAAPPDDIPQIGHAWEQVGRGASVGDHIYPEAPLDAYVIESFTGLTRPRLSEREPQANERLIKSIEQATGRTIPIVKGDTPRIDWPAPPFIVDWGQERSFEICRHQMLGAPLNVNMNSDAMAGKGYHLLLQLEPDYALHKLFLRGCIIQFWIKDTYLIDRRFERVLATARS
jgi:Domain of unknown function (DUF1963)